ncbi:hypothetical protein [Trebonia sp.]|uniref:hypothetical protein n=1 Tax=Trebonia sp. TaxID=2767075 RepID=UPI00261AAB76|nr:hypothetical protein [Trebonia sp.]
MKPVAPDEQLAAMLERRYGGEASVMLDEHGGIDLDLNPASGGSVHARLEDMNSLILRVLLGGCLMPGEADPDGS